jgi:hypothetical protein
MWVTFCLNGNIPHKIIFGFQSFKCFRVLNVICQSMASWHTEKLSIRLLNGHRTRVYLTLSSYLLPVFLPTANWKFKNVILSYLLSSLRSSFQSFYLITGKQKFYTERPRSVWRGRPSYISSFIYHHQSISLCWIKAVQFSLNLSIKIYNFSWVFITEAFYST